MQRAISRHLLVISAAFGVSSCGLVSTAGPSAGDVVHATSSNLDQSQISVVDVSNELAQRLIENSKTAGFFEVLGEGTPVGTVAGRGDALDVSIWEAPPAALFGSGGGDARISSSGSTARGTSLPEQIVDQDGTVQIPFVGSVLAAGRTPKQIEQFIISRLMGKANQPQVLVRISQNANRTVTVVGEVANSARVPLGPRGERLLDILATVGGTRQPVLKTTIQVARNATVVDMPLEAVIRNPKQNIRLQPGDVVTAMFQSYSFTALGATGRNEEVPFEATGLTLAQALGRSAGLQDSRADAKGVFIFRFEPASALAGQPGIALKPLPDGTVPVIYRVNLRDPRSLFIAQNFPMRNKDVLYVSNAPIADIQKFVNVIYSTILPLATAATVVP